MSRYLESRIGYFLNLANLKKSIKGGNGTITDSNVARFVSNGVNDINKLVVNLDPKQDGEGVTSPSNVRQFIGYDDVGVVVDGKNIIPYPYYAQDGSLHGVEWTTTKNKIIGAGTTTRSSNFYIAYNTLIVPAGTWTLSIKGKHIGPNFQARNVATSTSLARIDSGSSDDYKSFALTENTIVNIYFNLSAADVVVDVDCSIQLESGSVATEHEEYSGTTYNLKLQTMPNDLQPVEWVILGSPISTNYLPNEKSVITAYWNKSGANAQYVYVADSNSSGTTNCTAYATSGGNWRFGNKTASVTTANNVDYITIQSKNGIIRNGNQDYTYTGVNDFTSESVLRLYGVSNGNIKLKRVIISENDITLHDYVAVRKTDNSSYGFWDNIDKIYLEDSSGNGTYGDDTIDPNVPNGIYGGCIDIINGILTIEWKMIEASEQSWRYDEGNLRFVFANSDVEVGIPTTENFVPYFCTAYSTATKPGGNNILDKQIGTGSSGGVSNTSCIIKDTDYTSVEDFISAINGVKILYKSKTPTTYFINKISVKTVDGTNTIWSYDGSIRTIEYGGNTNKAMKYIYFLKWWLYIAHRMGE